MLPTDMTEPKADSALAEAFIDEEDSGFTRVSKLRLERRLKERWRCKMKLHSFCFTEHSAAAVHIQLSSQNIDDWVNAMVCPFSRFF